jgi:hypothetical protein
MKRLETEGAYAEVFKLKKTIGTTPQIAKYMKSDKREPYSSGIFVSILVFPCALIFLASSDMMLFFAASLPRTR